MKGIDNYKAAYHRQVQRNEMLVRHVSNLRSELERQRDQYLGIINGLDPTIHGMTRAEVAVLRRLIIELRVEMCWLIGEGAKFGLRNLGAGYVPDGSEEFKPKDEKDEIILETARLMAEIDSLLDFN